VTKNTKPTSQYLNARRSRPLSRDATLRCRLLCGDLCGSCAAAFWCAIWK